MATFKATDPLVTLLPVAGCGRKSKVGAGADPAKMADIAEVDSPTPAPAVVKKSRPTKAGSAARTGAAPDSDLMDMEQRYKALVKRIRPGMTTSQVEAILGSPDDAEEKDLGDFNPQKTGQTLEILTWKGEAETQSPIMLSFVNGRLQDGGTTGYDIRKGFKPK